MTESEKYRRTEHAEGIKLMAEGKTVEANRCFREVWASAKKDVVR